MQAKVEVPDDAVAQLEASALKHSVEKGVEWEHLAIFNEVAALPTNVPVRRNFLAEGRDDFIKPAQVCAKA